MDPSENPFSPGAGAPPPELSGRREILEKAEISLKRLKRGLSEKSFLLVGLRGVGKTVLLRKIHSKIQEDGHVAIFLEAGEEKSFINLLVSSLRKLLFRLDGQGRNTKVKRSLRFLVGFVNAIKVKYDDIEIGLDIDPERGSADSGDIEIDLPDLLESVGEAIQEKKTALAIIVDEIQYLSNKELSAMILAIHRASQRALPITLMGAGLPQLIRLVGRSKSYAERLFDFPRIGPLKKEDAFHALQRPVKAMGVSFTQDSLEEIFTMTQGYSYFLQEWGYHSWNLSESPEIHLDIVHQATKHALRRLDEGFFSVRFYRLTESEKNYLRAVANLGNGAKRSGAIAESLNVSVQRVAPIRDRLMKKGMIYDPAHGEIEFTVPLFGDFMKRFMP